MAKELPVANRILLVIAGSLLSWGLASGDEPSSLHPPSFSCTNSGAVRVTCEGRFLDGTSAAGITVRVLDKHHRVVHVGAVDANGRITFRKPDAEFHVVFDGGHGNVLTLLASDMT